MTKSRKVVSGAALLLLALAAAPGAYAQALNTPLPRVSGDTPQPPDSGLNDGALPGARDRAAESSPLPPLPPGTAIRQGTSLQIRMTQHVDSGSVRNGDNIHATLAQPVTTTSGQVLRAGTAVEGTVVSAARAGMLQSGGVLTLQLTRVGSLHVVSDVAEFDGQEGHRDVADAAPQKGSEAAVQAGALLNFKVLENGAVPGLVQGAPPVQGKDVGLATNVPAPGSTGQPSTQPGVSQRPTRGATQGVVPAGPK